MRIPFIHSLRSVFIALALLIGSAQSQAQGSDPTFTFEGDPNSSTFTITGSGVAVGGPNGTGARPPDSGWSGDFIDPGFARFRQGVEVHHLNGHVRTKMQQARVTFAP
ncbi:MAG: hypothetical protein AAF585_01915, partial [Verrucomicrobiota bacterium]